MSYVRTTDFLALLRATGNGVRTERMPGLDWLVLGLAAADMFLLWVNPTTPPPTVNPQITTVWLKTASVSYAAEGDVFLWDAGGSEYVQATPALWAALFGAAGTAITDAIEFVIDGAGSAITTGTKGYLEIPFGCTISQVTSLADQTGSIVVNIWKCTYAQFDAGSTHPVVGDNITGSTPPTISSGTKAQDGTLTGWTTTIAAGSILAYHVDSAATVQRVTISLKVSR